ncbi:MAG: DUF1732 domain-containing protein [bacterium]|nr:DUF1732 domain-containing protein [bacterium]
MIKSMTGYAKVTKEVGGYGSVSLELKGVNGKNFSISFRMPPELSALEQTMRTLISSTVKRGTLNVSVSVDYSSEFIESFVKGRIAKLSKLSRVNGFGEFSQLIFSDISNYIPVSRKIDSKHAREIQKLSAECLKRFESFRKSEGKEINKDLTKYASVLFAEIRQIESYASGATDKKRQKLKNMLEDKSQLLNQEIMVYADKIDISEEISRFKAHLARLKKEEYGASMSFILQEMLREANTMSAKSEDLKIIQVVLKIKETIEKLKEQANNVE